MELIIGLIAVGTFGLIATIAEREPQPKRMKRKPNRRYSNNHR